MAGNVKLTDVCDIIYGYPFDSKKFNDSIGIGLIRIRDILRGFTDTYTNEECGKEYLIKKDDLLIGMDGEFNIAKWKGAPSVLNQRVCKLNPKNNIDKNYLFYRMPSLLKQIESKTSFVTVKHLSAKQLNSIHFLLPELDVQEKIAKVLSTVDLMLELRNRELDMLDLLVKSRFIELFGDIESGQYQYATQKLGTVAKVGSSHRVFTTEFVKEGIPFYRGTEISQLSEGKIPLNPFYITEEHYKRLVLDDNKPMIGDLLMPSICDKGQVWMINTNKPFYYKDGRVLSISPNKHILNPKYLKFFMKEKTIIEYPKLGSGSTFAEFKIFILKDIEVLVPPMYLQNQFADFVQQVDKSKLAIQQSFEKLETLKKSLMQEYFG